MAKNVIDSMELKLSSPDWNTVKLSEYHNGRRTEHEYSRCSKKLVLKLLNASKAPTISEFEGWLKDEDDAREKKNGSTKDICVDNGCCWYGSEH